MYTFQEHPLPSVGRFERRQAGHLYDPFTAIEQSAHQALHLKSMFKSQPRKRRRLLNLAQQTAIISLFCGVMQAYSTGPDPRYSGAPGDNAGACTSCHQGQALNTGKGSVKILLSSSNSYSPGVKQHITVQVTDPQQRRWGFQMSARLKSNRANGQAGDFSPSDGFTQVLCDNFKPKPCTADALVQFIEHTSAGTRFGTSGGVAYEFDWTPPATDSGNVVFYVAANAANGDGNLTGDHIYTSSLEITSSQPTTPPVTIPATKYAQHNLVSDVAGLADQTDANMINPWGIALNATGPFGSPTVAPAKAACTTGPANRFQPPAKSS